MTATVTGVAMQIVTSNFQPDTGVWVQLKNLVTAATYTSAAATPTGGTWSVSGVPPGSYEIYFSSAAIGPWADSGSETFVPVDPNSTDAVSYAGNVTVPTLATGSGSTGSRPTATAAGTQWFDTTLGLPIWWNGSAWITPVAKYTVSITPAAVAASTIAEQTFTVTGVATGQVVSVSSPAAQTAGIGIVGCRVSAANTVAIAFINNTAGSLTPVSGSYVFMAL